MAVSDMLNCEENIYETISVEREYFEFILSYKATGKCFQT